MYLQTLEWSCLAEFGQWELLGSLEAERKDKPGSLVNVLAPGHVSTAAFPLFRLLLLPRGLCFSSSRPFLTSELWKCPLPSASQQKGELVTPPGLWVVLLFPVFLSHA